MRTEPVTLRTITTAHPTMRPVGSVPLDTRPTTFVTLHRAANATEVNAVAALVERIAPEVTVRSVARRGGVYVVKALEGTRPRIYRIPLDMVRGDALMHGAGGAPGTPIGLAQAA